jgi:hypothetical protein
MDMVAQLSVLVLWYNPKFSHGDLATTVQSTSVNDPERQEGIQG